MSQITLDSIRDAAEAKYGSTDIELGDGFVVKLLNPLRLPKEKRDALGKIGDRMDDDTVDQAEVFADAIRLAAEKPLAAERLIEAVAGDLAVLAQIFESYTKGAQVGEASASQN